VDRHFVGFGTALLALATKWLPEAGGLAGKKWSVPLIAPPKNPPASQPKHFDPPPTKSGYYPFYGSLPARRAPGRSRSLGDRVSGSLPEARPDGEGVLLLHPEVLRLILLPEEEECPPPGEPPPPGGNSSSSSSERGY
jgi:hypothetical protein